MAHKKKTKNKIRNTKLKLKTKTKKKKKKIQSYALELYNEFIRGMDEDRILFTASRKEINNHFFHFQAQLNEGHRLHIGAPPVFYIFKEYIYNFAKRYLTQLGMPLDIVEGIKKKRFVNLE